MVGLNSAWMQGLCPFVGRQGLLQGMRHGEFDEFDDVGLG